jgi:cell wall-associated NlpC family hydrolase
MDFTGGRSGLGGRAVNRQHKSSAAADRLPYVAVACTCFALLFLAASTAWGQSAGNGFTLQQVMSSPFPSNVVAAKHAPRVAWIFNAKGVRNIWVADAPDFSARQVTHYAIDGQPLASLRLTPDGRTAVYVRGSETNRHGEVAGPDSPVVRPHQEVWAVDAQVGEPRRLGAMECDEEECEDVELSPDGQHAVWAARDQLWVAPV